MIAVANFISLPLLFLSTTFLARSQMPHWMRIAARFNPVNWGVNAARAVVLPGTDWGAVGVYLAAAARAHARRPPASRPGRSARTRARSRASDDRADRLAGRDRLADRHREAVDRAGAVRRDLVLHLHRLDDAEHLADLDDVAVGDLHGEHRALHRARHDLGRAAGAPAAARSRRRRASSRNGASGTDTFTVTRRPSTSATVSRCSVRTAPAAADAGSAAHRLGRQLLGARRELRRLDDPVAGLAGPEARMLEQRLVEADQRLHAADLELAERAQHPPDRILAVDAAHDQLRDHRVVERRDHRAGRDAGVDPHARPGRLAVGRDRPGRRAGSRATDPRR